MEKEAPYSFYEHLRANDVIGQLRTLLDHAGWNLRTADGKLFARHPTISTDTPWLHVQTAPGLNCGLWHQITFNMVSMTLPVAERFVPRHCQNCWKVVCKPRTLEQLFNLLELEKSLGRPSKCGIEQRDSVHGLYGGYFYNKGKEAGLECYEAVKEAIAENEVLAPLLAEADADGRTTRLILKRACTEFEHACGPSDKWVVTPEQNAIEDLIDRWVVSDGLELQQPDNVVWNVKRRWIEFAYKNGDQTYLRYTGGKPLYPDYVTYHQKETDNVR